MPVNVGLAVGAAPMLALAVDAEVVSSERLFDIRVYLASDCVCV